MLPVLKLVLFVALGGSIIIAGYKVYRYCNKRINGSNTMTELLLYVLLMIAANASLFILGVWGLLKVYEQLS